MTQQKTMNPALAMQVVREACASVQGNLQMHSQIQAALSVLNDAVVKQMAAEQKLKSVKADEEAKAPVEAATH